jgi:hypothetical protein
MALADPQVVTFATVNQNLLRVGSGVNSGSFAKDDRSFTLAVSHQYGKRIRRVARFGYQQNVADYLDPSIYRDVSMSATLTFDLPGVPYFNLTTQKQFADMVSAYLTASSGARVTQLLAGES